jgi:hypothetical protein
MTGVKSPPRYPTNGILNATEVPLGRMGHKPG